MRFEWDPQKAAINLRKHGISFDEAASVLDDPMLITAVTTNILAMSNVLSPLACPDKASCLLLLTRIAQDASESSAHARPRGKRNDSMQKQNDPNDYELRNEYDFTKMTIVPRGRFAPERRAGKNMVLLAPDVREAFPTDEAVNDALRLVLEIAKLPSIQQMVPA